MRQINVTNPTVNQTAKTYVSTDYTSGTLLSVDSNVSFAINDLIIVGEPTEEFTELKKVSTLSGNNGFNLVSNLGFNHPQGSPVYKVPWDFVYIESQPANGVFSVISQSPLQWDSKTNETYYVDTTGDSTFNYRFRYYNSVLSLFSEYSPTLSGSLPTRNSVRYMIQNIRQVTDDLERKVISDLEIIRLLNRAQDIVYSHNTHYWFLRVDPWSTTLRTAFSGTPPNLTIDPTKDLGIATVANQAIYPLSSFPTLAHVDILQYRYHPVNDPTVQTAIDVVYVLRREQEVQFDRMTRDLNRAPVDIEVIWKLLPGDSTSPQGYFQVNPVPKGSGNGYFYPTYYQKIPDLSTNADLTVIPFPSILEDYVIGKIFAIKGDEQKAMQYGAMFTGPADAKEMVENLSGLDLLDEWDKAQSQGSGQPRNLWKFMGQKAERRFYGEYTVMTPDYKRETYF